MEIKPEIRYLNDLKKVLYDKEWAKKSSNLKLYFIYRGSKKKNGLRYDVTIIPPRMLGKEFVKTKGHYHIGKYQELYQVLEGKAIFLLQKTKREEVEDVYGIKAKKGGFVLIPSDYGHITINPSNSTLKISNWVSEKCQNDYQIFEEKGGGCYYYTKSGWIKNRNYKKIPELRFEKPLKEKPKNLDFLK